MNDWSPAAWWLLTLSGLAVFVIALRDVLSRPVNTKRVVHGAVAVVLVTVAGALTLAPITASTGAVCFIWPSTGVLGPEGSQQTVIDTEPGTERISTQSCIDIARERTVAATVLILLGGATAIANRRRRRPPTASAAES